MPTGRRFRTLHRSIRSVSIAALALVGTLPVDAQELERGVVLDVDRRVAYAMAQAGGIEALDLASGRLLWSTTAGARPLALAGPWLLAQIENREGRLRLAVLDVTARGRPVRELLVPLPEGAAAPIDEPAGVEFRLTAASDGSTVELHWSYLRRALRGTAPDADEPEAEPRASRFSGALRADLATGHLEPLAERSLIFGSRPLPASVAAEADAGAYRQRPLWAGEWVVATQEVERNGQRHPVLRRFSATGASLPEVVLPQGDTLQLASIDNRHVLISHESGDPRPARAHAWTVFALASGERVGELSAPVAAARFAVMDGRVLFVTGPWSRKVGDEWVEEPLQLHAVAVTSGQQAWAHRLRDTTYHGPWVP